MSSDVGINRLRFARYGERKDGRGDDVVSAEEIRSGAVAALHPGLQQPAEMEGCKR